MNAISRCRCIAAVLLSLIGVLTTDACARDIMLHLSTVGYDGARLQNVPLVVVTDRGRKTIKTDENGTVRTAVDVGDDEQSIDIVVIYGGGVDGALWPADEARQIITGMIALTKLYFFEQKHRIELRAEVDSYEVEIKGWPTITVSGVVVGEDDSPFHAAVVGADSLIRGTVTTGRRPFRIHGVRRDAAGRISIMADHQVMLLRLTAQQTSEDLDLGKITIPALPTADAQIDPVCMSPIPDDDQVVLGGRAGITLVEKEGRWTLSYDVRPSPVDPNILKIPTKPGEYYRVPAGTYYIAPGAFSHRVEQIAVIEAAQEGRDLSRFNVPTVTLGADVVNSFEANQTTAYVAIRKMISELQEQSE